MNLQTNKITFWLMLGVLVFSACHKKSDESNEQNAIDMGVRWELRTNFTDTDGVFEGNFQLANHGNDTIKDNWTLFFSMMSRAIQDPHTPQQGVVQHINGDWYKLVPQPGFSLAPGDSTTIVYWGESGVIKESDRPMGLYVVTYDSAGAEQEIVEITDYSWAPFERPEQMNRGVSDLVPVPTPAWSYQHNQAVHALPASEYMPVIPSPVRIVQNQGEGFTIDAGTVIYHPEALANEAGYLAEKLRGVVGTVIKTTTTKPAGGPFIELTLQPGMTLPGGKEAYHLEAAKDKITITGNDAAGVFYGVQTLRAILPVNTDGSVTTKVTVPTSVVDDAPRFAYRGAHLDVARNFQIMETVKREIDLLAYYKINRLLFYITEDEGWRLEIPGLPELTEVGSHREHTSDLKNPVLHPAFGSGPFAKKEGTFGYGFYTRDQFIDMLRYANARHIKVIPDLCFPGHARSAIKSMEARYQRLMKEGKPAEANEYRLIDPDDQSDYGSPQGYGDNIMCVACPSVYHFYEKIVDEVAVMYREAGLTLNEIHTGGDEVPEGPWTNSPKADSVLQLHPEIGDPHNLQAWGFTKLLNLLKDKHMQIDGWEEVALLKSEDGEYVPNPAFADKQVVPYIWNNLFGSPDLSYKLANAGYPVVLCYVSNFYFDLGYSKDPKEPGLYWGGFINTYNAWAIAPFDMTKTTKKDAWGHDLLLSYQAGEHTKQIDRLTAAGKKNIRGLQAQLWSETVHGRDELEYRLLPKLLGLAESAWAPERVWEVIEDSVSRNKAMAEEWNRFANTLAAREFPRLNTWGYNYRVPLPGAVVEGGTLQANCPFPGLTIRYTTDGTEPTVTSTEYTKPVQVKVEVVKLRCFDKNDKPSRTITLKNKSL